VPPTSAARIDRVVWRVLEDGLSAYAEVAAEAVVQDRREHSPRHFSITSRHTPALTEAQGLVRQTTYMPAAYAAAEKRAELVRAATALLHRQGLQRTTLVDVAEAANVPLGNVYYYFKTKDALAEAVLGAHEHALRLQFASWVEVCGDARRCLRELVLAPLEVADSIVDYGCPHGSLCQELSKLAPGAPLAKAAAHLLGAYVTWAAEQYRALGCGPREARDLAGDLIAAIQGTMLLAHTMRSKEVLGHHLRRIERSIDDSLRKRSHHRRGS
jgi:TetR/AcrR family transcriptional regulator, transcriptional repressor for nem operon